MVTVVHGWIKERKSDGREKVYASLQLITALEQYTLDVAQLVADLDDAEFEASQEHDYAPFAKIKQVRYEPPSDVDWRWIGAKEIQDVLSLPNKIKYMKAELNSMNEWADPFQMSDFDGAESSALALQAWETAARIRKSARLPKADYSIGKWKFLETLTQRRDDRIARMAEAEKKGGNDI
ncbi:hypothetical protein IGB42_02659 [Andreprevotia sp. IGB-42]|uniref:hypothetical protein n=1 Tax=Andreprevotia sp. IGB-42 TaxID=2497473 RepID=UPI00135A72FA|nr:hypothetical protein [Andreprevotia sp. IGB-42]KAF0812816.1 hypothetical protein IGB42_02659 [Andreprevotia sp. IGB-42]